MKLISSYHRVNIEPKNVTVYRASYLGIVYIFTAVVEKRFNIKESVLGLSEYTVLLETGNYIPAVKL